MGPVLGTGLASDPITPWQVSRDLSEGPVGPRRVGVLVLWLVRQSERRRDSLRLGLGRAGERAGIPQSDTVL